MINGRSIVYSSSVFKEEGELIVVRQKNSFNFKSKPTKIHNNFKRKPKYQKSFD